MLSSCEYQPTIVNVNHDTEYKKSPRDGSAALCLFFAMVCGDNTGAEDGWYFSSGECDKGIFLLDSRATLRVSGHFKTEPESHNTVIMYSQFSYCKLCFMILMVSLGHCYLKYAYNLHYTYQETRCLDTLLQWWLYYIKTSGRHSVSFWKAFSN